MIRNKIAWLIFPVLLTATLPWVSAQEAGTASVTLKGLPGVGVIVGDFPEGAVSAGLTSDMIRADVELQLKNAGIRVLTNEERKKTLGRPALVVIVEWVGWKDRGLFAANMDVELLQEVLVVSNRQRTWDTTWYVGAMYGGPVKDIEPVRAKIRELVDHFAKDFLSANPKEATQ